ncbi:hypothetical protein RND71_038258 [Anisodus tanguticus]|uniref:Hexosyltransferase n=1 Tax=Anisodus tanguticus TaxID=243964 RepID=A0AAE1UTC4_9SOLA|nr:hypothetical protein RND71_038258 [Anisodus tanguticus]
MLRRKLLLASLSSFVILLFIPFISFNIRSNFSLTTSLNNTILLQPQFALVIGIFTRPGNFDRRHFLRLVYGIQSTFIARIDVKFIFCNITDSEQRTFIALEIMRFNDIIVLNCSENMNSGKTYTYFSTLPQILPTRYDYVMKADDDVYLRLAPLASSLQPLPRVDLYYGFVIPCPSMNPFVHYMSGMGFILSWDLVEWIGRSNIPVNNTYGPEDKLVGQWLNMGNKAKNRFTNKPRMYDYPGTNGRCSHELIPDTIAVHRLKKWEQWIDVLRFFNVTKHLQPSTLYSISFD